MVNVDTSISDIVFNTDLSDAYVYNSDGDWVGFNEDRLHELISDVRSSLRSLGVLTPSVADLVQDLYARL